MEFTATGCGKDYWHKKNWTIVWQWSLSVAISHYGSMSRGVQWWGNRGGGGRQPSCPCFWGSPKHLVGHCLMQDAGLDGSSLLWSTRMALQMFCFTYYTTWYMLKGSQTKMFASTGTSTYHYAHTCAPCTHPGPNIPNYHRIPSRGASFCSPQVPNARMAPPATGTTWDAQLIFIGVDLVAGFCSRSETNRGTHLGLGRNSSPE